MKRQLEQLRILCAVLILGLTSPMLAGAATSTGVSPSFTVDLQVSPVAVSGRVLNATSRAPLNGATVTLAGQNTGSSASGAFAFASVSLNSGNTITVGKSGFATYTGTVPVPAGSTSVTLPDILLQPMTTENANKPIVTGIRPRYDGLFLSAASLVNEYTALVDWAGRTPKQVEFYVNGVLRNTVMTSSAEALWTVDMAQWFTGSFSAGANELSAVAWTP